jgi:hypothetical protein
MIWKNTSNQATPHPHLGLGFPHKLGAGADAFRGGDDFVRRFGQRTNLISRE